MGLLQGFVEGGLASVIAGCTTHPLDLVKVRMQLQGEQQQQMAAARLQQGVLRPALIGGGGGGGSYQKQLLHTTTTISMMTTTKRGGMGTPGMASVAGNIVRAEGVRGLFTGVSATMLRQSLYSTTRMGLYEALKGRWSDEKGEVEVGKKVAAGLVAGGVGAAVGNPADVAMVRMQADGRLPAGERRNYKNAADAVAKMVKEEGGVAALWRGSALTVQRAMVVTAAQLATYDTAKDAILKTHLLNDGLPTHVAASFTAGLVAAVASNPLDVLKTRIMNMGGTSIPPKYTGALDCLLKTLHSEGPLALYKGFLPTVMRQGPFTVVLFVSLEQIRLITPHLFH